MILVDATGYGENGRFERVANGIYDLLNNVEMSLVINRNIGAGVSSEVFAILQKGSLVYSDIRCGNTSDSEVYGLRESGRLSTDILVVDDAEQLDRLPELAKLIEELRRSGTKIIYVVLVPVTLEALEDTPEVAIASSYSAEDVLVPEGVFILSSGMIPLESIETPQPLKDRFLHVELTMEGPAEGQSYREWVQEQSNLYHDQ